MEDKDIEVLAKARDIHIESAVQAMQSIGVKTLGQLKAYFSNLEGVEAVYNMPMMGPLHVATLAQAFEKTTGEKLVPSEVEKLLLEPFTKIGKPALTRIIHALQQIGVHSFPAAEKHFANHPGKSGFRKTASVGKKGFQEFQKVFLQQTGREIFLIDDED